jgi:LuxR family maltose regulon positive regulatory protein
MTSALVQTKLYVPRLRRRLVARPRLSDRLRRGAEARLTLVSAPAGFGKTTLLAEWLAAAHMERSVAWLSLEESDRQAASYWTLGVNSRRAAVRQAAALHLLARELTADLTTCGDVRSPHCLLPSGRPTRRARKETPP